MKHELDPQPWVVTFGVKIDATLSEDRVTEVGVSCMTAYWDDAWRGDTSNAVTLLGADVVVGQDGAPLSGFVPYPTSGAGATGGTSSEKLPQNCALLVTKQTSLGGRRGKGRCFLPGVLNEAGVDAVGQLTEADRAAWQLNCNEWRSALEDVDLPMVVLHENPPALAPTPVISLVVDPVISTQRRRLR